MVNLKFKLSKTVSLKKLAQLLTVQTINQTLMEMGFPPQLEEMEVTKSNKSAKAGYNKMVKCQQDAAL